MSLADLKSQLPDYAKDLRLNLESVLTEGGAPGLTQKQIAVIIAKKIVNKAAYSLADKPEVESACSPFAGNATARLLHVTASTHALWIC